MAYIIYDTESDKLTMIGVGGSKRRGNPYRGGGSLNQRSTEPHRYWKDIKGEHNFATGVNPTRQWYDTTSEIGIFYRYAFLFRGLYRKPGRGGTWREMPSEL
jgi:hypothetical protein